MGSASAGQILGQISADGEKTWGAEGWGPRAGEKDGKRGGKDTGLPGEGSPSPVPQ